MSNYVSVLSRDEMMNLAMQYNNGSLLKLKDKNIPFEIKTLELHESSRNCSIFSILCVIDMSNCESKIIIPIPNEYMYNNHKTFCKENNFMKKLMHRIAYYTYSEMVKDLCDDSPEYKFRYTCNFDSL